MQDREARGSFATQADWPRELSLSAGFWAPPVEAGRPASLRGARRPAQGLGVRPKLSTFWEAPRPGRPGLGDAGGTQEDRSQRERERETGGLTVRLNDSPSAVPSTNLPWTASFAGSVRFMMTRAKSLQGLNAPPHFAVENSEINSESHIMRGPALIPPPHRPSKAL